MEHIFKLGDKSPAAKKYQLRINALDRVADISADGDIGKQTLNAAELTAKAMGVSPYKGSPAAARRRQAVIMGATRTPTELNRARKLKAAAKKAASSGGKGWPAQRHWLAVHRGMTEQPPGSNRDNRTDGITAAQKRLGSWLVGLAWCGVWVANALMARGVKGANNSALAGVANCEDLARSRRQPFTRGWTTDVNKVQPGDAVVLFGRGVHIETVLKVYKLLRIVVTDGGNTGSGGAGSQSDGGGAFKRRRPFSAIHGFCLVED